jgi:hypothetical protein
MNMKHQQTAQPQSVAQLAAAHLLTTQKMIFVDKEIMVCHPVFYLSF